MPTIYNTRFPKLVLVIFLTALLSISCRGPEDSDEPTATTIAEATGYSYLVSTDGTPEIKVYGSEFEVTTNNCGSRASSFATFSRARAFTVILDAEFSESLRGLVGGDILVAGAEAEVAIGLKLGLQVGSTETISTERQVETPADSITIVKLQWQEIWQAGRVAINRKDGTLIGELPFRILTTMELSQTGIQDIPCGTFDPEVIGTSGETTPVPSPENPSPTPLPGTVPPTSPPDTPIPPPTNTSAPPPQPTPTPRPQPTNPPPGAIVETHEVDAYDTALGSSYSTGIYVMAGDVVNITYLSGQWWIGQSSNTHCNGFGDPQTPTDANGYVGREGDRVQALISCDNPNICRPLTAAAWGSLIGSIGDGGLFPIGNQAEFTAQSSGILFLRINYYNHNAVTGCPYGDGGSISVQISITPSS